MKHGGGFFNVNSARPFEHPTSLSNFFEALALLVISVALCYTFGVMVGDTRQGWSVLAAMTLISVTPLGGLVPMFLMQLGEVIYGGVGSGLSG